MVDVVDDEPSELGLIPNDGAVEELASQTADPAFREGVRHWGASRLVSALDIGSGIHRRVSHSAIEHSESVAQHHDLEVLGAIRTDRHAS